MTLLEDDLLASLKVLSGLNGLLNSLRVEHG